ncbi:MAG: UDP-N-acetylmuramoyl-tripeptide--D-alanyl-D-alanine ligase [Candidatus Nanopelagicaceae bacterium]
MIRLKAAQIAEIVGGTLNVEANQEVWVAPVFDSRKATPGSFFLALVGEQADGHNYIKDALDNGAVFALVSKPVNFPNIKVDDVLVALGKLAAYVRLQLPNLKVIGITGSQGKTTTKDLLHHILQSIGPTIAPENSFNNELGAPLNLLRCDEQTKYCIAELGARHLGDIGNLSSIVKPDVGIVLKVGSAHLSEFGSRENIAKAKGELIKTLPSDGVAILGLYDEFTPRMADGFAGRVITFGESAAADVRAADVEIREGSPHFDLVDGEGRVSVGMRLIGAQQIPNALAAAAAAIALGISNDHIATALSTAENRSKWRMQLHELPGLLIINDAYNAAPESMEAALFSLRLFAQERGGAAWAFLGKMHELGESSNQAHEKIGTLARDLGVDHLVAINAKEYGAALNYEKWEDALELRNEFAPGDVVLVKASRVEGLERLAQALIESWDVK